MSNQNIFKNAAEILYKDEKKKKKEKELRNSLISELGDEIEPKHILYSSNEELMKMKDEKNKKNKDIPTSLTDNSVSNENNNVLKGGISHTKINQIEPKDKKFENEVKAYEFGINNTGKIGIIGKSIRNLAGPDAAGMLNIAEGKEDSNYTKNSTKLLNINDNNLYDYKNGEIKKFKEHIENKVQEQLKDFGYNLNEIEGRIYHDNSAPIKRIKNDDSFKEALIKNKDKILNGENFTTRFKKKSLIKTSNLHNAFGSVDFLNSGMDNDGNLHLYMFDTYDFNANEGPLVEAGRRQMLKGNLKGNFSIHDIVLTKDELDKIWNKK